jgi:hypothetical protein
MNDHDQMVLCKQSLKSTAQPGVGVSTAHSQSRGPLANPISKHDSVTTFHCCVTKPCYLPMTRPSLIRPFRSPLNNGSLQHQENTEQYELTSATHESRRCPQRVLPKNCKYKPCNNLVQFPISSACCNITGPLEV